MGQEVKTATHSKTIITNTVGLLAGVSAISGFDLVSSGEQAGIVVAIISIVNIILRFMTKSAVKL